MSISSISRQPQGIPVGGQFAVTAHAESTTSLAIGPHFENFPHPDRRYEHPMEQWPSGVELPTSVRLDHNTVESPHGDDPQDATNDDCPSVLVTMPNGATFSSIATGPTDDYPVANL